MTNKNITIVIGVICMAAFSCKKKDALPIYPFLNHSPHLAYPFIKTITNANQSSTFFYDTVGRVIGVNNEPYTYSGDTVYSYGIAEYVLNTSGQAAFLPQSGTFCNYNSLGYLTDSYWPNSSYKDTNFYQNNNMIVSIALTDTSSSQGNSYEATLNFYNTEVSTIDDNNYGMPYLGKPSPNLLDSTRSVDILYAGNMTFADIYNYAYATKPFQRTLYTYTYNALGYVASCTSTNIIYEDGKASSTTSTNNYTYY